MKEGISTSVSCSSAAVSCAYTNAGQKRLAQTFLVSLCSLLIALAASFSLPQLAWAEGEMSGDCSAAGDGSVTWALTQNNEDNTNPTYTLTISGNGAMGDWLEHRATGDNSCGTDVSSETCDNPKCALNRPWVEYLDKITVINISEGVTRLGSESLTNATKVSSIILPESLKYIGFGSLAGMTSLTSIDIPAAVKSIETSAFYGDSALIGLNFSTAGNLEKIGNYSFSHIAITGELALPEGLKELGIAAFERCEGIEKIVIPASLESYVLSANGLNNILNGAKIP